MLLTLALLIVIAVLAAEVARSSVPGLLRRRRDRRLAADGAPAGRYDPGRELRAERRAQALLRSCVEDEEWEMYRDLGFIRVWGGGASPAAGAGGAPYAYLIYPHKPIVCYVPQTGRLLTEYCVEFADRTRPFGSSRLPASDDVLAKWMALSADERRLIEIADVHLPGRQVDPARARRDLLALARWERSRLTRDRQVGSLPAS